jgi:hypothetical protein
MYINNNEEENFCTESCNDKKHIFISTSWIKVSFLGGGRLGCPDMYYFKAWAGNVFQLNLFEMRNDYWYVNQCSADGHILLWHGAN